MSDAPDIRTVALVCPSCKAKLRSPRGDVVHFCRECRTASEVRETTLVSRELVTLGPDQADGETGRDLLRLPLWCYRVHVDFAGDDEEVLEDLRTTASPEHVFVPAFRQRNVMAFGDMGQMMTLEAPRLLSVEPRAFSGATLGSAEASRLVEPVILQRADGIHDVTEIEVQVSIESVAVVTVPALDEGDHVTDLVTRRRWPSVAFLDLEAIRASSPVGQGP